MVRRAGIWCSRGATTKLCCTCTPACQSMSPAFLVDKCQGGTEALPIPLQQLSLVQQQVTITSLRCHLKAPVTPATCSHTRVIKTRILCVFPPKSPGHQGQDQNPIEMQHAKLRPRSSGDKPCVRFQGKCCEETDLAVNRTRNGCNSKTNSVWSYARKPQSHAVADLQLHDQVSRSQGATQRIST